MSSTPLPAIDPELVALAHLYFQRHVPERTAPGLCTCLRPYPCNHRGWAIDYLVRAGRLVLAQPSIGSAGSSAATAPAGRVM